MNLLYIALACYLLISFIEVDTKNKKLKLILHLILGTIANIFAFGLSIWFNVNIIMTKNIEYIALLQMAIIPVSIYLIWYYIRGVIEWKKKWRDLNDRARQEKNRDIVGEWNGNKADKELVSCEVPRVQGDNKGNES